MKSTSAQPAIPPKRADFTPNEVFPGNPGKAIALLLGSAIILSFSCDSLVDDWFASHAEKWWKQIASTVSKFGDWPALMAGAAVLLIASWRYRFRKTMLLILAMMAASTFSGILANGLRALTCRTRPVAEVAQGWYGPYSGGQWHVGKYKFSSFPSAHTTAAMGFTTPVLLLGAYRRRRRWLVLPAVAIPLLVGWSRLYMSVHHFSDVVCAVLLGLFSGIVMATAHPWRSLFQSDEIPAGTNPKG